MAAVANPKPEAPVIDHLVKRLWMAGGLVLLASTVHVQPASAGGFVVADTLPLEPSPAPRLDQGGVLDRGFWERALREARRFRDLHGGVFGYIGRYGVSGELAEAIDGAARREGIDPELGFRLVRVESRFKTRARGPAGALGLMQLMPGTARRIDRRVSDEELFEPATNLRIGFRYLRSLLDMYDGDVRLALLAYNRGEGTVNRYLRSGRDPENGYSRKVLGTAGASPYRGSGRIER